MDLWIRSQDKKELIPIKEKLKVYEGDLIQTSIDTYQVERHYNIIHNTDFLGEYKSKERALEVLDEIQKVIKWLQIDMKDVTIGEVNSLKGKFEDYVYEMPKE